MSVSVEAAFPSKEPPVVNEPPVAQQSAFVLAQEVEKILRSNTFRNCDALRNLLTFLGACVAENRAESVKVKEIATAVFGRSQEFDSQTDSVVRVQTGRLRSKLAEYYMEEGADDEVIVGIPKGSYALTWHARHQTPILPPETVLPEIAPAPGAPRAKSAVNRTYVALTLVLMLASASVAVWAARSFNAVSVQKRDNPALTTFWSGFASQSEPALIVFSNLKLIGSLTSGIRVMRSDSEDHGQPAITSWTTLGEVMGVFDITRTLAKFGRTPRAKSGQLLSWDDARDNDLIFVGGPLAETPLREVPVFREFQFQNRGAGIPIESGAVLNVHPRPGEAPIYRGPESRPFKFDYAVVALRPAFNKRHRMLALAGVTEFGTAGAAEFLTREDQMRDLLSKLKVSAGANVPWFEALLRIKIEAGVPVQYETVLVHPVSQ